MILPSSESLNGPAPSAAVFLPTHQKATGLLMDGLAFGTGFRTTRKRRRNPVLHDATRLRVVLHFFLL